MIVGAGDRGRQAPVPPHGPKVIGLIEALSAKYSLGVPVAPSMSTGASDAVYTSAVLC